MSHRSRSTRIRPWRTLLFAGLVFWGCSVEERPDVEPADSGNVMDIERVYRFVDEVPRDPDGNIPQVAVGKETRMVVTGSRLETPEAGAQWQHRSQRVRIPDGAMLSTGLAGVGEAAEGSARFSITLDSPGEMVEILAPNDVPAALQEWHDLDIDLSPYAGMEGRFVFASETTSDDLRPVWGFPRIVVDQVEDSRPNLLLISLDTLRADHLGVYGYARNTSPGIDAFAQEAVVFEHAISPSSWTLPAHASLFTGLSPSEHGAISMGAPPFVGVTFSELAYEAGYRTGALTDGGFVEASRGFGQGFSSYVSDRKRAKPRFSEALEWIDSVDDAPFMLFLHTYQVHSPYRPPAEYAERFLPEGSDTRRVITEISALEKSHALTAENRPAVVDLYDAEIAYLDDVVASFFQSLRDRDVWDNTLVILFSDHGEQFWEHGQFGHGVSLHDEEIRVPLIVKPAGEEFSPGRVAELVSLTDVFATVVDSMGWPDVPRGDSTSFLSLYSRASEERFRRDDVISEVGMRVSNSDPIPPVPRHFSFRTLEWKLITDEASRAFKYYELSSDPAETEDRMADAPSEVKSYADELEQYISETAAQLFSVGQNRRPAPALSAEQQQELEALGYFQ